MVISTTYLSLHGFGNKHITCGTRKKKTKSKQDLNDKWMHLKKITWKKKKAKMSKKAEVNVRIKYEWNTKWEKKL